MRIMVSVDERVKVELTEHGKNYLAVRYKQMYTSIHKDRLAAYIEQDQKRTSWTLRDLFQVFGSCFSPDSNQMFKNDEIQLELK